MSLLRIRVADSHGWGWRGTQLYPPGTTVGALVLKECKHRPPVRVAWNKEVPYETAVIVKVNRKPAMPGMRLEDGDEVTLQPLAV